jgi:short-subunit dehydrogenase
MAVQLKKVREQTMVITGASSGIGLVTARMAAKRGARLVLAARSEDALARLAQELTGSGTQVAHVAADVGLEEDVRRVAETAVSRFGGFDTWVNNAGISIYGPLLRVPMEDQRRLFETNFWGTVYGSLVAAEHLRRRGGAIINIGSTLSDRALPMQGMYSASKHAVKGFTDALRMELEADGLPVSVTLVKPGAIDTPYSKHAKNYLEREPTNPPPVYAPEAVAEAILHCAERPERDVYVGGGGKMIAMGGHWAPRLVDRLMESFMISLQKTGEPARDRGEDGLHRAAGTLEERGGRHAYVSERSLYTRASLRPVLSSALLVGAGLAAGWLRSQRAIRRRRSAWV